MIGFRQPSNTWKKYFLPLHVLLGKVEYANKNMICRENVLAPQTNSADS